MTPEAIQRINELARKAKAQGLTPEEAQEQKRLRQEYLDSVRKNLVSQLENMSILEPDGTKKKVQKKKIKFCSVWIYGCTNRPIHSLGLFY